MGKAIKTVSKTFFAFGTVNTLTLSQEYREALVAVRDEALSLHARWSVFSQDSEISALNRHAGMGLFGVSDDTLAMLKLARQCSELTCGAFDITAYPLTRIWKSAVSLPDEQELSAARSLVDFRRMILREDGVILTDAGMGIDPGGVAKGYAADRAVAMLRKMGVERALINYGGTVIVVGEETNVGVRNPFGREGECMGVLRVRDRAVVTSGSYERAVSIGGKRYHHIIDPRTAHPADSGLVGVTLVGDSAAKLDALATGILVMGLERGCEILRGANIDGLFVFSDGHILATEGLREYFTLNK